MSVIEDESPPRKGRRKKKKSKQKKVERRCFIYGDTEYCDENECIRDLEIQGAIGSGEFGEVYEARVPGDEKTSYVVKIILLDEYRSIAPYDRGDFEREVRVQKEAASVGAAPLVQNAFRCEIGGEEFGFIVMMRIDKTLKDFVSDSNPTEEVTDEISRMLLKKIRAMHGIGIVHGDIGSGNIGLVFDDHGHVSDVFLLDFGSGGKTSNAKLMHNEENVVTDDDQWRSILDH